MSNLPKKTNSFKNIINFKDLLTKEKNKDQNITNSRDSTHNTTNKCKIFQQISLNNNLTNYSNLKKIPSSTTNIGQIKTYSKFKMHNIKSEKRLMVKGSKKKILNLLRNSEKLKVKKKRSFNGKKKEEEKNIEPKKLRYDNYGNIINKKNKKMVHIVFADELNEKSITEEIQIESYKKLNFMEGLPKEDSLNPSNAFNKCCNIY
jgi:hypothetical protein